MFLEAFVAITIGSYFLNRKDLKFIARGAGALIGKTIGTMQAMRIQMDTKSRKSDMYQLHGSIKQGLQGVKSITSDIAAIASSNPRSILYSSNAANSALHSSSVNSSIMGNYDQPFNTSNQTEFKQPMSDSDEVSRIHQLAKLAIADKELNQSTSGESGSDIIMQSLTDSIISTSYSLTSENQQFVKK